MAGARTAQQLGRGPTFTRDELLGHLELPPGPATLEPVDYAFGAPATAGMYRLRGSDWSWFGKVLQHVRHWPGLAMMPPEVAADFVTWFPWREELQLWRPDVMATFPAGLRPPLLHGVVELPDDRLVLWQEDVAFSDVPFDLDTFARAAFLLGRWNARSTDAALLAGSGYPANHALRKYAANAVPRSGLQPLADDALWSHPWLAGAAELRADLLRLGGTLPGMLDRLDDYRQALPHGDASPHNLLVPEAAPDTFVVIDLSFRTPHALGFDLSQLLVGLTQAGTVPAARVPEIAATILPAYVAGLAAEGITGHDAVRDAFVTSALVRTGFDTFLYDLAGSEEESDRHAFDERVALSRFLVAQYREVHA